MSLQKEEGKILRKKIFFVGIIILKITKERAGSGSRAVSQGYGSEDPDPYQYVTDPENWVFR
jgi:hypothetical protein